MAGDLKFLLLALLLFSAAASAQSLPDPTRPPAGLGADSVSDGMESGQRLQSILIPKRGRPMAVISGQSVRVGDKIGDGKLVRLTETEAVIEGPQGVQRLRLTPSVEKTPVVAKTGSKSSGKKKEKP